MKYWLAFLKVILCDYIITNVLLNNNEITIRNLIHMAISIFIAPFYFIYGENTKKLILLGY